MRQYEFSPPLVYVQALQAQPTTMKRILLTQLIKFKHVMSCHNIVSLY